ncbi:MAG: hypothetical protein QW348_00740 [Ignisphaera sp.]
MKQATIIELGEPAITSSCKLTLYSHKWSLVRVFDQNLIAHPHIMLYSDLLLFSNAPFIRRYGDKARAYSIVLDKRGERFQLDLKSYTSISTYTEDSSILLPLRGDMARVLQFRIDGTVNEYDVEKPHYILPQGDHSYVVKSRNILAIARSPTTIDEITQCKNVFYRDYNGYKMLQCVSNDENILVVSDGLYGYSLQHRKRGFTVESASMGLNTVVFSSQRMSLLVHFSRRGEDVYEIPFKLDDTVFIDDNTCLGRINNKLVLYSPNNDSLKILKNVDRGTSIHHDALHGYIALKNDNEIELIDVDNNLLLSIKMPAKDVVLVDSKLILLNRNRIIVYSIETNDKRIRLEKLRDAPTTLVHCIAADSHNILCIDLLGRLLKLDVRSLVNSIPKMQVLRSDKGIVALLKLFSPGYPIKFWPSDNLNLELKKLDAYSTMVSIKDGLRNKAILTVRANGVLDSLEKTLKAFWETHEVEIEKPLVFDLITALNGTPLACNESLRKSLMKCLNKAPAQENHKNSILTCFVDVTQAEDSVKRHQMVFINKVRYININPEIRAETNSLCLANAQIPDLKGVDIGIEVLCDDKLYTLNSGCVKIDGCNYIKMLVYAKLTKDGCVVEVPISYDAEIHTNFYDGSSIVVRRGLGYHILIPVRCYSIESSRIVYKDGLKLEVVARNRCRDTALTIALSDRRIIIPPETEIAVETPLDIDDIIRSYKELVVIEPSGPKLIVFPLELGSLLGVAHKITLKVSALTGLRRWLEKP